MGKAVGDEAGALRSFHLTARPTRDGADVWNGRFAPDAAGRASFPVYDRRKRALAAIAVKERGGVDCGGFGYQKNRRVSI
jgi:hypothetical protein